MARGVTLFQKVRVPILVSFWSLGSSAEGVGCGRCGRGFPPPCRGRGLGGGCAPPPENCSLLTLEKAHFGGYLTHSDILILKVGKV